MDVLETGKTHSHLDGVLERDLEAPLRALFQLVDLAGRFCLDVLAADCCQQVLWKTVVPQMRRGIGSPWRARTIGGLAETSLATD